MKTEKVFFKGGPLDGSRLAVSTEEWSIKVPVRQRKPMEFEDEPADVHDAPKIRAAHYKLIKGAYHNSPRIANYIGLTKC